MRRVILISMLLFAPVETQARCVFLFFGCSWRHHHVHHHRSHRRHVLIRTVVHTKTVIIQEPQKPPPPLDPVQ